MKLWKVLGLGLGASVAVSSWAQTEIHLTLADALARAPQSNFSILIQRQSIDIARAEAKRELAGLLPSITATASQGRQQVAAGGEDEDPIIFNSFSTRLRGTLSLIDPQAIAEYKVARTGVRVAELDLSSTVQDVLQGIANAYFTHVRNLARLNVIEANIERDKVLLNIAQNKFDAGVATPIDVTRAEVALAGDELDLLQQRTAVYESELTLKQTLNLDLEATLTVVEPPVNETALEAYTAMNLDAVFDDRPDYQREMTTLQRNEQARRAARWERFPALTLSGDWGYSAEDFTHDWEEEWGVRVGIDVPIWEGNRIQANVLQAQALVRQQQLVVEQLEQQIEADYRFSLRDVRSTFAQIAVARRRVELRERELELARVRFEQGVADNSDVVNAQALLAVANDDLVEAKYRYNLSRLGLARTRGDVLRILEN